MRLKDLKKAAKKKLPVLKEAGFIIWQGPSLYDGAPLVAIATMQSANEKTGNMVQVWILRQDIAPHDAILEGSDGSICGDCPLKSGGGCYELTWRAPTQVYAAFLRGVYVDISADLARISLIAASREVRLGAYGDPAFVPYAIIQALISRANGHTGYTHQWDQPWFDARFLKYCMASANNTDDARFLEKANIRYFLAVDGDTNVPKGTVVCPNLTHGVQCRDCLLCSGGKMGKNVVTELHGAKKRLAAVNLSMSISKNNFY